MSDSAFRDVAIEALCVRVTSGGTPLRSRRDFYDGGTVDWFKTGELNDWYLDRSAERITTVALDKTSAKLFPANTVLIAMYGDGRTITTLGMLRRPAATNQACAALIADMTKCEHRFLFYALKFRRHRLIGLALGGAQRNLSAKTIKQFMLPAPDLPIQQRIASILSAYDDLIENCQRRIRILEDMARGLYREWFVHFRFPGADSLRRVDSPLGPIPQGWGVTTLAELSRYISRGVAPRYETDGESTVLNQKCIRDQRVSVDPARRQSRPIPNEKRVLVGDVLVNSTGVGTLGRVAQVLEPIVDCTVDTHVTIVRRAASVEPHFFGLSVLAREREFERLGVGATGQTELGRASIGAVQVIAPPQSVQRAFGRIVEPLRSQTVVLVRKVNNLRRTRDLLLPRLISGQINVAP